MFPLITCVGALGWLLLAASQSVGPQACSFPSKPQLLPLPRCPPVAEGEYTADDAAALAWRVAPIVYMHPLEPYRLQSPKTFFDSASVFYQDYRNSSETRYQFLTDLPFTDPLGLQWDIRQFVTVLNSTRVSREEEARVLAGAEVSPEGLSSADVYYTVFEPSPDAWGFTYNLFYSFNGCSQQMFSLGVNGSAEVLDLRVCPFGTHEADWERVSVLACKAGGEVKQVAYSQHGWQEVLDCEAGQCPMEGGHPVTHAALETHANYPAESNFMVYEIVNASLQNVTLVNLGGLHIGDRTKADPRLRFVPTPDNVKAIPDFNTIMEGNLSEWEWALFGGVWGGPLRASAPLMQCYFDNQTRLGDCPEGYALSAYNWGIQFFKKLPLFASDDGVPSGDWEVQAPSNKTYFSDGAIGSGILGPLMRTYSYLWPPEVGPPVYSNPSQPLVCPGSLLFDIPFRATSYTASVDTLVKYLAGISAGCALFAMLMTTLLALPALLDKQAGVKSLTVTRLRRLTRQAGESMRSMRAKPAASHQPPPPTQPQPRQCYQGAGGSSSQPPTPLAPPSPSQRLRTSEAELVPLQMGKQQGDRSSFLSSSPTAPTGSGAAAEGPVGMGALRQAASPAAVPVAAAVLTPPLQGSGRKLSPGVVYWIPPLQQEAQQEQQQQAAGTAAAQVGVAVVAGSPVLLPTAFSNPLLAVGKAGGVGGAELSAAAGALPPFKCQGPHPGPCATADVTLASPAAPAPEFTAVVQRGHLISRQDMVWAGAGFAMYAVGVGFLAHGTDELYRLGDEVREYIGVLSDVFQLLKIIVATGLSLTGLIDIVVVAFLFFSLPRATPGPARGAGARLAGLSGWVQRNSHAIHVAMAALLLVVITLAMVLFGVGLVALVAQLALQMACAAISRVTFSSIPLESLCLSLPRELALVIPGLGSEKGVTVVCLWELINTCFYLSEFLVWDLVVGSALLLWSHLIFLVLVITSMWLTYRFRLSLGGAELRAAATAAAAAAAAGGKAAAGGG